MRLTDWLLIAALLIIAFAITIVDLQADSLWRDEGWSAWIVHDDARPAGSLRELVRATIDSPLDALVRVIEHDLHPPLYYLTLDAFTLLAGESVLVLRLPSLLAGMLALAAIYALARRLMDHRAALYALIILATASFFVYYNREARSYALWLALSVISTLLYVRWSARPRWGRALAYAISLALLFYTHYLSLIVVPVHLLHGLLWRPRGRVITWPLPFVLAGLLFAPWIPAALHQQNTYPGGPLGIAPASDAGTLLAFWLILTSGLGGWLALPFIFGRSVPLLRSDARARCLAGLALIGLMLPTAVLFALNVWVSPLYQTRYLIVVLPFGALLAAYGLRHLRLPDVLLGSERASAWSAWAALVLLAVIALGQLLAYPAYWPPKPRWADAFHQAAQMRQPLDPAIIDIDPRGPGAFYDRQYALSGGVSMNIGWRLHTPEQIAERVALFDDAPSVWAILPANHPQSWDVIAQLSQGRVVGYRDSVMEMLFYRFDRGQQSATIPLQFGDQLAYESATGQTYSVAPGQPLCVDLSLLALADVPAGLATGLHLTRGYNTLRYQLDAPLPELRAGAAFRLSDCIELPADAETGPYHLRLSLYDPASGGRLPVIDASHPDQALFWGDFVVVGVVSVG